MARPGPAVPHVEDIVRTLRRGQRELARNPKGAIEAAVRQLLAPRTSQAAREAAPTPRNSYRIDDLAQLNLLLKDVGAAFRSCPAES